VAVKSSPPKAVLKTRAVQTLRDWRASPNLAQRLECGAFTAALFPARSAVPFKNPKGIPALSLGLRGTSYTKIPRLRC